MATLSAMTAEAAKAPHRIAAGCPVTGAEDSVARREAGMAEEVTEPGSAGTSSTGQMTSTDDVR